MSKEPSRKQEQRQLIARLRVQGLRWDEVADVLRARYQVNARVAMRLAHGWTQRHAAAEWNGRWPDDHKTAKNFSYWETWPVSGRAPSLGVLDNLARLYECNVTDLLVDVANYRDLDTARRREAEADGSAGADRGEHVGDDSTSDQVRAAWDGLIGRRELLIGAPPKAAGTLRGPAKPSPGLSGLTQAVQTLAGLTAAYWHLEGLLGPLAVFVQAREHHRLVTGWLREIRARSADDAGWRHVGELVTQAGIQLGWLHFDLEQPDEAALVYRQTFDIADELGDIDLQAFLVGRMSRTLSEWEYHREALACAELARRLANRGATAKVRSWLTVTRAHVHACLGDERAARTDLDLAQLLLEQAEAEDEPPPPYVAFFTRAYLRKWTGQTLLRLPAVRDGRAVVDEALSLWPAADVRELGEVLAAAASARLADHELDEAVRLATEAYEVAMRTGSPRVLRHVIGLRRQMHRYRRTQVVRAFDEYLLFGR